MRNGWIENKLIELCEIYQPKTIAKSLMTDAADYIVYGANGPIGRYSEFNHEEEQVVVTCRGATCGTVNMTPKFTWITGNAMVVKPINENLTKNFLYYLLSNSSKVISAISGSAQPQITRESLGPLKFHIPPLPEQKRIVDLISSVDFYIASLEKQLETGKSARNAILHELLSTPGPDWIETTLGELIEHSIGGVWGEDPGKSEVNVPVFRQTEFNGDGKLSFPPDATRSLRKAQLKTRTLKRGDILIQKSAGTPSLPGRVVMVPEVDDQIYSFSNFLHLLRPDINKVNERFAFLLFWTKHQSGRAFEYQRGTNIKNLDLPNFLTEIVTLPPLPEQKKIVEIISEFDSFIEKVEKAIEEGKKLRSGLLSELLSGEHEIPASYDKVMSVA